VVALPLAGAHAAHAASVIWAAVDLIAAALLARALARD
jgi:hypothetical protein